MYQTSNIEKSDLNSVTLSLRVLSIISMAVLLIIFL